MSQPEVVSIGGVDYNKYTGLPVTAQVVDAVRRQQAVSAKGIHKTHQRSTALNRQFVKKVSSKVSKTVHLSVKSMDVRPATKQSPHITKFVREPQVVAPKNIVSDVAPIVHPAVARAHIAHAAAKTAPALAPTARDIKHAAIGKALLNAKAAQSTSTNKKPRRRALNVAAASLGVLLIAGYFTYVNLPNISVRVAAAQAGIEAKFPEYRPVGYHLNGPVAYQDGEVSINFGSNSGPLAFSLNQSRSGWDSSALLEKYVDPRSNGKYAIYNDAGLTIYTYGTDAAWVNGGILYTVEGTATLSNEQIRRIATSM